MFCRQCGKEIEENALFCSNCGASTTVSPTPLPATPPAPAPTPTYAPSAQAPAYATAQPAEPQKTRVNGLGIAGFVVSILSLWLGVYFCVASIIALGLSIAGFALKKRYNSCNGLATAALVISIVSLSLWGLIWLAIRSLLVGLLSLV